MGKLTITLFELCMRWPEDLTWGEMRHILNSKIDFTNGGYSLNLFILGDQSLDDELAGVAVMHYMGQFEDVKSYRAFIDEVEEVERQYPELVKGERKAETKPCKESEQEKIIELAKKHNIKKGQAKDMRIAYLYDDEKLEYFNIGEILGFEYQDEIQASSNLRGRAARGRQLRKQYNE